MIIFDLIVLLAKIAFVFGCVFIPLYLAIQVHPLYIVLWFISVPLGAWTTDW